MNEVKEIGRKIYDYNMINAFNTLIEHLDYNF